MLKEDEKSEIDFKELKRLSNNDEVFFREMLEIFIRSAETGMATIEEEFAVKNFQAVSDAAHKMKAPCRHIKANSLFGLLSELENSAKDVGQEKDLSVLINEIKTEVKKTVLSIQDFLQNNKVNPGEN